MPSRRPARGRRHISRNSKLDCSLSLIETNRVAIYLGIDIGGTKTDCAAGDERAVLGLASSGAAKLARVGEAAARSALQDAVHRACAAAGAEAHAIARTCVGMAGASRPEAVATMRRLLAEIVPGEIAVAGDMEIAHQAAFAGGPGLAVIAGTGSIAYGRNPRGESARAGGWGPAISDEGSGDWIGRAAVGSAMLAYESGHSSRLIARIMDAWGLATQEEVVRLANSSPPPDFAALFPHVVAAADAGDAVARDLLVRSGHELSQLALIVVRRLWPEPQALEISLCGGVFQNSSVVREVFTNILARQRPDARVGLCARRAAEGALDLARHASQPRSGGRVAAAQ